MVRASFLTVISLDPLSWRLGASTPASVRSGAAVSDDSNSAKGDKDPAEWLPPEAGYHCRYVSDRVVVKTRWDLSADQDELDAIHDVLATCPTETLIVVKGL